MKINLVYFDDEESLQKELNLNHDELWAAGICLDDWDYGFIIKNPKLSVEELPTHFDGIMQEMSKCDVTYKTIESKGIKFIVMMTYHA